MFVAPHLSGPLDSILDTDITWEEFKALYTFFTCKSVYQLQKISSTFSRKVIGNLLEQFKCKISKTGTLACAWKGEQIGCPRLSLVNTVKKF